MTRPAEAYGGIVAACTEAQGPVAQTEAALSQVHVTTLPDVRRLANNTLDTVRGLADRAGNVQTTLHTTAQDPAVTTMPGSIAGLERNLRNLKGIVTDSVGGLVDVLTTCTTGGTTYNGISEVPSALTALEATTSQSQVVTQGLTQLGAELRVTTRQTTQATINTLNRSPLSSHTKETIRSEAATTDQTADSVAYRAQTLHTHTSRLHAAVTGSAADARRNLPAVSAELQRLAGQGRGKGHDVLDRIDQALELVVALGAAVTHITTGLGELDTHATNVTTTLGAARQALSAAHNPLAVEASQASGPAADMGSQVISALQDLSTRAAALAAQTQSLE